MHFTKRLFLNIIDVLINFNDLIKYSIMLNFVLDSNIADQL